ncbi:MAG: asparagine synthase (glutamine-hydrolyzing), partial [Candidatus Omnitrophica bacterium]|nr:asparagine synthase (glutamine-hydrolyzing) [Candidatus Omnitrophota bacterium]
MCGVAGFFHYKEPRRPGDKTDITRMTDALQSRGPDESGMVSLPGVCLGHRRLKVIDLVGGQQPMESPDGRYRLVFNGEIYGFKSLRSRHESRGRIFRSSSDTECLLASLEESWDEVFSGLDGMYDIACYDKEKQELFLVSDAFGKKPLYYTDLNGTLVFASELKSLLQYPGVRRSISTRALNEYLAYEYIPAPGTIFQNIFKLDRGTCLKVNPSGLSIRVHRNEFPPENLDLTIEESVESLRSELDLAVQKRLVSDVPLGVFLSGGLDSTAVLGTVKKLQPGLKIKSFSIGFEEASFDESGYARFAARKYDAEHTEFICSAR